MMDQTQNSKPEPMADDQGGSPIDAMISRVDAYIQNPKMVTPETLTELKTELEDLKGYVDGEETPQAEGPSPVQGMMSQMKGGK